MKSAARFALRSALAGLLAFGAGCASSPGFHMAPEDEYGYKAERAPAHWGDMGFPLCATGTRQSPIEIKTGETKTSSKEVALHYQPTSLLIRHTQHTLRIPVDPGSYAQIGRTRYDLLELHFHRISEHVIDGIQFPLEAHLVHESARGELMILAALIKFGDYNWDLLPILQYSPPEKGEEVRVEQDKLNLDSLLGKADEREFFEYEGSLSVPPCTEGVRWLVLKNILGAGMHQQYAFRKLVHGNYRATQPLNDRSVLLHSHGAGE